MLLSFAAHASPYDPSADASAKDVARYKSHIAYKQALAAYNKQDYEKALKRAENSLEFYASNKKSRELLTKLWKLGAEYYKTGASLVHFKKELAVEYLNKSQILLSPYDKKTRAKVTELLKELEGQEPEGGS
jgi:hypothetical protein